MPSRKDSFGYGVTIPPTTARVVDTAAEILGSPDPDELAFMHTVPAQCCLPYREPLSRDYFHRNGRASSEQFPEATEEGLDWFMESQYSGRGAEITSRAHRWGKVTTPFYSLTELIPKISPNLYPK